MTRPVDLDDDCPSSSIGAHGRGGAPLANLVARPVHRGQRGGEAAPIALVRSALAVHEQPPRRRGSVIVAAGGRDGRTHGGRRPRIAGDLEAGRQRLGGGLLLLGGGGCDGSKGERRAKTHLRLQLRQ